MTPREFPSLALAAAVAAALAVTAARPASAEISDLVAFLQRAERMNTVGDKVEAEVTVKEEDGSTATATLTVDPAGGGTLRFARGDVGWTSTTPLAWASGSGGKGGAATVATDDPLGDTDIRTLDFFPFWKTDYTTAFISDESPTEKTVSLYASKERPYTLYVITFDKAKMVPNLVKYYRETFNNLVRVETYEGWTMVGSRPRPSRLLVRDFGEGSTRSYEFAWKVAAGE